MSLKQTVLTAACALVVLMPLAAQARHWDDYPGPGRYDDGDGHGHENWHGRGDWHGRDRREGPPHVVIVDRAPSRVVYVQERNRTVIRDYYVDRFRDHCPPGLVRQGRACAPVRHVTYVVGNVLPETVVYEEVPPDVIVERPPVGYRYVRVDDDVLLLDASRHIVDAISLIEAANR